MCIFCANVQSWMWQDIFDEKSTLVQIMSWCCQPTSHCLSQCWPRPMSPYDITRQQQVNSLWPRDSIWHHWCWSILVQITACCLFRAKPLPEPMMIDCQMDTLEKTSMKSKYKLLFQEIQCVMAFSDLDICHRFQCPLTGSRLDWLHITVIGETCSHVFTQSWLHTWLLTLYTTWKTTLPILTILRCKNEYWSGFFFPTMPMMDMITRVLDHFWLPYMQPHNFACHLSQYIRYTIALHWAILVITAAWPLELGREPWRLPDTELAFSTSPFSWPSPATEPAADFLDPSDVPEWSERADPGFSPAPSEIRHANIFSD